MAAGKLRERLHFQKRAETDDGYGNPVSGDFATQFTRAARVRSLRGSEPIINQRLQGVQPVVVTVRTDSSTKTIDAAWRAVDSRDATKVYNIRAVTPDEKGAYIDFLAEAGVAT